MKHASARLSPDAAVAIRAMSMHAPYTIRDAARTAAVRREERARPDRPYQLTPTPHLKQKDAAEFFAVPLARLLLSGAMALHIASDMRARY